MVEIYTTELELEVKQRHLQGQIVLKELVLEHHTVRVSQEYYYKNMSLSLGILALTSFDAYNKSSKFRFK